MIISDYRCAQTLMSSTTPISRRCAAGKCLLTYVYFSNWIESPKTICSYKNPSPQVLSKFFLKTIKFDIDWPQLSEHIYIHIPLARWFLQSSFYFGCLKGCQWMYRMMMFQMFTTLAALVLFASNSALATPLLFNNYRLMNDKRVEDASPPPSSWNTSSEQT